MTDDIWEIIEYGDRKQLADFIARQQKDSERIRSDDNLLCVAWQVNRSLIPGLLEHGVSPDQRNSVGGTTLMYASAENDLDVVTSLLEAGADANAKNDDGETAFSYACANNSFGSAKLIHAAGADVNTVDAGGGLPLDWASNRASNEFYSWLESIGCRLEKGDITDIAKTPRIH